MLGFSYLFAAHTRCPNPLQKHELSPKSDEFWQSLQNTLCGISFFVVGAVCFFAIKLVIINHHQSIFGNNNAFSG